MANHGNPKYFLIPAVVVILLLLKLFTGVSAAAKEVYKICSNCHTMHSSQHALPVREGNAPETGVAGTDCIECHGRYRWMLLKMDCIGCHARGISEGNSIINQVPQVAHSGASSSDLAGGNFRYGFGIGNQSNAHNVHGFGNNLPIGDLSNYPPGYDPSMYVQYDQYNDVKQVMCAGANGCHGNRDQLSHIEAMRGSHHTDDTRLQLSTFSETGQGTTPGLSYRFLYGVHGGEDSDWEKTKSASDHNEYKGAASPTTPTSYATTVTISQSCAVCHGNYHSAGSSPWQRHPGDIPMPNTGEYAAYGTSYNNTIPLARQTLPYGPGGSPGTVTLGGSGDVIMCLSCHRAHGSEYSKILRWDYKNPNLSTALSGCAVCHTSLN